MYGMTDDLGQAEFLQTSGRIRGFLRRFSTEQGLILLLGLGNLGRNLRTGTGTERGRGLELMRPGLVCTGCQTNSKLC